jgi:hypothetical protein
VWCLKYATWDSMRMLYKLWKLSWIRSVVKCTLLLRTNSFLSLSPLALQWGDWNMPHGSACTCTTCSAISVKNSQEWRALYAWEISERSVKVALEKLEIHTFHVIGKCSWTASGLIWFSTPPPASLLCPLTANYDDRPGVYWSTFVAQFYISCITLEV